VPVHFWFWGDGVENGRRRYARLEIHLGGTPKDLWPEIIEWAARDLMPAMREPLLRCPVPTYLAWVDESDRPGVQD
jgi:hypothetical protein